MSRKLMRSIARTLMQKRGIRRINKGKISYFSSNWRDAHKEVAEHESSKKWNKKYQKLYKHPRHERPPETRVKKK